MGKEKAKRMWRVGRWASSTPSLTYRPRRPRPQPRPRPKTHFKLPPPLNDDQCPAGEPAGGCGLAGAAVAEETGGSGGVPEWGGGEGCGRLPPRPALLHAPRRLEGAAPARPPRASRSGPASLRLRLRPQNLRPPAPSALRRPAARWAAGTPPPPARARAEVSAAGGGAGTATRSGGEVCRAGRLCR